MKEPPFSQRAHYDNRYMRGIYDKRDVVPVLRTEAKALRDAAERASISNPNVPVTIFDWAYGQGRVTNEYILDTPGSTTIAYDVSSVGLRQSASTFVEKHGFKYGKMSWDAYSNFGYIAGEVLKEESNGAITIVRFVHASENDPTSAMQQLVLEANDGKLPLLTTSWYGSVGHIMDREKREEIFRAFGQITDPLGEVAITVCTPGDLVQEQKVWELKHNSSTSSYNAEYVAEDGQTNYYHLYPLNELTHLIKSTLVEPTQRVSIEAVKAQIPHLERPEQDDEHFTTISQINTKWSGDISKISFTEYEQLQQVVGIRSSVPV